MALFSTAKPARKGLIDRKVAIAAVIIAAIAFVILILYFYLSFANAFKVATNPNIKLPNPHLNASIADQDVLFYTNAQQLIPFVLISYQAANITAINANISILQYPAPGRIYILNVSNECFNCGSTGQIEKAIYSSLIRYRLIENPNNVSTVSLSNLRSIEPNSILIVINGLLPSTFLNSTNGLSTLAYLLNRHTSIIYVGQDFSRILLPGSVVTPTPLPLPQYLATIQHPPFNGLQSTYYFNKSAFSFFEGANYQFMTYENVYNGSIIAFPNTPNSWGSPNQTGSDIAKAVYQLFWLPKYAYGSRGVATAFAVPSPGPPSQACRFFRAWSRAGSPRRR